MENGEVGNGKWEVRSGDYRLEVRGWKVRK
jgi:hypothetical protein